jgi:hypothetical protein
MAACGPLNADVKRRTDVRRSRIVLVLILASFLIVGALDSYFYATYGHRDVTAFAHLVLLAGLMFTWCKLDVRERSIEEPAGSALLVALIAVVGVPLYFFRTRTRKEAWKSTIASLGFVLLALAVLVIGSVVGELVAV